MKITVGRLKAIIQEELDEAKKPKYGGYKRDEGEPEESPEEDLGDDAYAESAEQTEVILDDLKEILEKWEEAEYESDEERWQSYAQDIQGMIDQYEGEEEPAEHTEEECEEVHPDQTHEEWEAEEEEEEEPSEEEAEEEEEGPKKPKPKSKKKSSSKNFPYESKQLEQMIYKELITAFSGN